MSEAGGTRSGNSVATVAGDDGAAGQTDTGDDAADTQNKNLPPLEGPYCEAEWNPEWYESERGVHTCCRPVWADAEDGRCWWHTTTEKSFTDLLPDEGADDELDEVGAPLWRVPAEMRARNRASDEEPSDPGDERGYWPDHVDGPFPDAGYDGSTEPAELLCGATLSGIAFGDELEFTGVWFNDTDLSGANLNGASMAQADMERIDLSGAVLRNTDLRSADVRGDLRGAYMTGIRLSGGRLGKSGEMYAALPRANLSRAVLDRGDLRCANLENADLSDASVKNADLRRSKLEGTNLERAALFDTDLREAAIYGARLTGTLINDGTQFLSAATPRSLVDRLRARLPAGIGDRRVTAYAPGESDSAVGQWEAAAPADTADTADTDDTDDTDDTADRGGTDDAGAPRWRRAMWTCQAIQSLARTSALVGLQREAFLRRKDLRRRYEKRGVSRTLATCSSVFMRYGEGYARLLSWAAVVVGLFALVYPTWGLIRPVGADGPGRPITWARIVAGENSLWESVYYSTLTFTNLGFGDYQPAGSAGQMLTVVETSIGVVLLALLVFVVGRRAAR